MPAPGNSAHPGPLLGRFASAGNERRMANRCSRQPRAVIGLGTGAVPTPSWEGDKGRGSGPKAQERSSLPASSDARGPGAADPETAARLHTAGSHPPEPGGSSRCGKVGTRPGPRPSASQRNGPSVRGARTRWPVGAARRGWAGKNGLVPLVEDGAGVGPWPGSVGVGCCPRALGPGSVPLLRLGGGPGGRRCGPPGGPFPLRGHGPDGVDGRRLCRSRARWAGSGGGRHSAFRPRARLQAPGGMGTGLCVVSEGGGVGGCRPGARFRFGATASVGLLGGGCAARVHDRCAREATVAWPSGPCAAPGPGRRRHEFRCDRGDRCARRKGARCAAANERGTQGATGLRPRGEGADG